MVTYVSSFVFFKYFRYLKIQSIAALREYKHRHIWIPGCKPWIHLHVISFKFLPDLCSAFKIVVFISPDINHDIEDSSSFINDSIDIWRRVIWQRFKAVITIFNCFEKWWQWISVWFHQISDCGEKSIPVFLEGNNVWICSLDRPLDVFLFEFKKERIERDAVHG